MSILDWIQPGEKAKETAQTKAMELAERYGLKFPKRHNLESDPEAETTPATVPKRVTPHDLILKFMRLPPGQKLAIIGGGAGSLVLILWLINRR